MLDSFGDERGIADLKHGSRINVLKREAASVSIGSAGHTGLFHMVET